MQLEMPWSDRLAFISIFFTFISEIVLHLFKLTFSSHFLCVSVSFCADIADSIVVSDSRKKIEDNVFGSTWFNKCGDFVRKLNLLGENLKLQVVQSSLGWVGVCVSIASIQFFLSIHPLFISVNLYRLHSQFLMPAESVWNEQCWRAASCVQNTGTSTLLKTIKSDSRHFPNIALNANHPTDAKISAINVFTCWQSFRYRLFRLCSGWNFFLPLSLAPITDKSKKESPPKWCCRTIVFREIKHWLPAKCGKFYAHNWIEWTARVSNFSYILINFKSRSIDQIKRQME